MRIVRFLASSWLCDFDERYIFHVSTWNVQKEKVGRRNACVLCGFLPRVDSVISMRDTCFTWVLGNIKRFFVWKTGVLLGRGTVPVISMRDTCFTCVLGTQSERIRLVEPWLDWLCSWLKMSHSDWVSVSWYMVFRLTSISSNPREKNTESIWHTSLRRWKTLLPLYWEN